MSGGEAGRDTGAKGLAFDLPFNMEGASAKMVQQQFRTEEGSTTSRIGSSCYGIADAVIATRTGAPDRDRSEPSSKGQILIQLIFR